MDTREWQKIKNERVAAYEGFAAEHAAKLGEVAAAELAVTEARKRHAVIVTEAARLRRDAEETEPEGHVSCEGGCGEIIPGFRNPGWGPRGASFPDTKGSGWRETQYRCGCGGSGEYYCPRCWADRVAEEYKGDEKEAGDAGRCEICSR